MDKVNLLHIMLIEYSQNWGFRNHAHEYIQAFYVLSGNKNEYMICDNQKIPLATNTLIFIKKNAWHSLRPIKKSDIRFMDLKFEVYDQELADMVRQFPLWALNVDETLIEILQKIRHLWRKPSSISKKIIVTYMELFLLLVMNNFIEMNKVTSKHTDYLKMLEKKLYEKQEKENNLLSHIMSYVGDNMTTTISLDEMAKKLNYTKEYLCRTFKKNTGWTITYYANYIKIIAASRYLKNTNKTIEEISDILNFSSSQYFSKVFKNIVGIRPGAFKTSESKDVLTDVVEYGEFTHRYYYNGI